MSLRDEIFEQPAVLRRVLVESRDAVEQLAAELRSDAAKFVFLAGRGTSDHAGLYAKYLWGIANRLPIALAAPSMFSHYQSAPDLKAALVVAISQSGQSPDIVEVLEEGARQGARTVAISNDPSSPLASAADHVLDICAGEEHAVAATKTYTAQLATVAALSVAMSEDPERRQELEAVPGQVECVLALDSRIAEVAERYRYVEQCVVLGRGYNYATAFEWSLKLKELAYLMAAPYSSADFRHGPIAVVAQGFPVFAVVPQGVVFDEMLEILERLKREQRAELLVISDHPDALALADRPIALPAGTPEWLSPLVSIVAAQLFCYHLTRAKGLDTDEPRGLSKITRSW